MFNVPCWLFWEMDSVYFSPVGFSFSRWISQIEATLQLALASGAWPGLDLDFKAL